MSPLLLNLTEFRSHLYQRIDEVITTGQPLHLKRNGVILKISRDNTPLQTHPAKKLVRRQEVYVGKPEDFVHMDWSHEWSGL